VGGTVEELLTSAFTDPTSAAEEAAERLPSAAAAERVELLRIMGIACRELRQVDESVRHLSAAFDAAVELGDPELEGRASMSLAGSLSYSGDFERSLELVTRAVGLLDGDDRVIAMSQRATLLHRAGQHADALAAFTAALEAAVDTTDRTIVADIWTNRGVLLGLAGEIDAAEADTRSALHLFESHGWTKRAADMRHNLAWLSARRGDLVESFRRFDDAEQRYESVGVSGAAVYPDRAEALLAAGLPYEALMLAAQAVHGLRAQGADVDVAEVLMLVARAALLADDVNRAATAAGEAVALFEAQGRAGWWAAAASLRVEARDRAGAADESDAAVIDRVIAATDDAGLSAASAYARVLAAELAAKRGDVDTAERHLAATGHGLGLAARCRRDLVAAQLLAGAGRPEEALRRCAATVDEFASLTSVLGGTELRAHVAMHVAAVVDLGVAMSVRSGDAELAFAWSERQRASALATAPVRPPGEGALAHDLDLLRAAVIEFELKVRDGVSDPQLALRCAQLQDSVRRRTRQAAGERGQVPCAESLPETSAGDVAAWISYVEVEGELVAIRLVDGQASIVQLGPLAAARRQAGMLLATLTMHLGAASRGLQRDPVVVHAAAAETAAVLLDPLDLPDGLVVLSPSPALHELPWALLPALHDRPFVVAPSAGLWRRCRARPPKRAAGTLVVCGPGLPLADAEGRAVAACYADATLLEGEGATVGAVEDAMRRVDVAHLVCHGSFSSGNPMFSSLRLADGPMFVYDLERLSSPPRVVVLSACSAGIHATPAGKEILGLTASLLATGPRAVIAATVAVLDASSTVDFMGELHRALAAGTGPAEALRRARRADPIIGGAFACHGAD
jgi:tetratricopeptide (TPR) repeat protein